LTGPGAIDSFRPFCYHGGMEERGARDWTWPLTALGILVMASLPWWPGDVGGLNTGAAALLAFAVCIILARLAVGFWDFLKGR